MNEEKNKAEHVGQSSQIKLWIGTSEALFSNGIIHPIVTSNLEVARTQALEKALKEGPSGYPILILINCEFTKLKADMHTLTNPIAFGDVSEEYLNSLRGVVLKKLNGVSNEYEGFLELPVSHWEVSLAICATAFYMDTIAPGSSNLISVIPIPRKTH